MIVCVCKGLSDRAISAAIDGGATDADAVAHATGAGTDCGCCVETVEAMVSRLSPCCSTPCPGCPLAGRRSEAA
jgi:bacterioferritin-associated ferredoxin